jgi:hypothetical protein
MSFNAWIRQIHRWLSVAFTLSVATYVVVMTRGPVPVWLNLFPAGSLILMFLTGMYLFLLPHLSRRRMAPAE